MRLIVWEGRGDAIVELGLPLNVTVTLGETIEYGLFHHRHMHSLIKKLRLTFHLNHPIERVYPLH